LSNGYIKEVFTSLQGEGKYVGALQLFVRFSGCNIGCIGCDTDYSYNESFDFDGRYGLKNPIEPFALVEAIHSYIKPNEIHSIAITGGEPLFQIDFLKEFSFLLKNYGYRIFLETSGFMIENLNELKDFIDIISLDLKLKSAFGIEFSILELKKIDPVLYDKVYVKVIVNRDINYEEIKNVLYGLRIINKKEIYLHFLNNFININKKLLSIFYSEGVDVFFIPQLHKLLEIK